MKNLERTTRAINRGIAAIDDALALADLPDIGTTSLDQLRRVRHQLRLMLDEVEGQALPSQDRPLRRIGPIITDSWQLQSELADAVLNAENEYVRYMSSRRR